MVRQRAAKRVLARVTVSGEASSVTPKAAQRIPQGQIGNGAAIGQAAAFHPGDRLGHSAPDFGHQPRFTQPGLADQRYQAALA
jgi:hypothetical protein